MNERITIENFGGLKKVTIPLNSINVFIGKQASGKSVSAKLLYFFKRVFREIFSGIRDEKKKPEIDRDILKKFEDYFPREAWSNGKFFIKYEIDENYISLERVTENRLKIDYSEKIKKQFSFCRTILNKDKKRKENLEIYRPNINLQRKYNLHIKNEFGDIAGFFQIFIPAGRSFFAHLDTAIYTILANDNSIDPFLAEFGSFYRSMKEFVQDSSYERKNEKKNQDAKQIDDKIFQIIGAKYFQDRRKDYLLHEDKRRVVLSFSSSGQQETLPLSIILKALTLVRFAGEGATVYIEEPEAHLFPSAQKKMVELIASVYNDPLNKLQFVITTHSPYILTSFNNLIHAGLLREQGKNNKKLEKIVPVYQTLKPQELSAFEMRDGKIIGLIDKEYGLITAESLDQASEDIAKEFSELINLE